VTNGTGTAGGARGGSGAARGTTVGARAGGVPEGLTRKGKTETGGCTTGSENRDFFILTLFNLKF
jgi:hypothetical protein